MLFGIQLESIYHIHHIFICVWISYRKPITFSYRIFPSKSNSVQLTKRHDKQAFNTQIIYYMFSIVIQIYNSVKSTWFHWGKRKFAISESNVLPFLFRTHIHVQFKCICVHCTLYIHFSFEKEKQSNEFHSSAFFCMFSVFKFRILVVICWNEHFFSFVEFLCLCLSECVRLSVFVQFYFLYNFFLFSFQNSEQQQKHRHKYLFDFGM